MTKNKIKFTVKNVINMSVNNKEFKADKVSKIRKFDILIKKGVYCGR